MKSLEKIIEIEKYYQNIIIDLYLKLQISKWEKDAIYDRYKDDFKQIKQDLEVLEIIKNKNVDIGRFKARCYISSNPHHLMRTYNCDCNYIDDELSIDEVIKLKQWLEVNENE